METAAPSDDTQPLATLVGDPDFRNIYDVPFVTVNRVGAEYEAEVVFSGDAQIDMDRLQTAFSVARERGFRPYARVFIDYDAVLIYFTDDPSKGIIWALADELSASTWLQ